MFNRVQIEYSGPLTQNASGPLCQNLPLLFNESDNPRDEKTIKVGAKRHIANIFRTRDVVTLERKRVESARKS